MKKITILGSAAAEGIPAMFCHCRVCTEAWKNGGKDIRMRTAYRLNDHVRIDFGPDTLAQEYRFRLHSENLKHLFITHSHEDHLYPYLLDYRMPGFSVVEPENILNIYGNSGVIRALYRHYGEYSAFSGDFRKFRLNPVKLDYFQPVELKDEDMTFYPLPANHMPSEEPMIYAVRWENAWFLIANDSGYFPDAAWKYLAEKKFRFQTVVSDCTGGLLDYRDGHMSGKFMLSVRDRLAEIGCIDSKTRYVINHFSHNGQATHSELEAHYRPYGIEVGFDGMELPLD